MFLQPTLALLVLGLSALSDASAADSKSITSINHDLLFQNPSEAFPLMQSLLAWANKNTQKPNRDNEIYRNCNSLMKSAEKKGEENITHHPAPFSRYEALLISLRNIYREIAILLKPFCDFINPTGDSPFFPYIMKNPQDALQAHMMRVVYTDIIPEFASTIRGDHLRKLRQDRDAIHNKLPEMQSALILRLAASTLHLYLYYDTDNTKEEPLNNESWSVKDLSAKHVKRFLKAASETITEGQTAKPGVILPAIHWSAQSYEDYTNEKKGPYQFVIAGKFLSKATKTAFLRITGHFITRALKKMGKTIPSQGLMKAFHPSQDRMEAFRIIQGFESIRRKEQRDSKKIPSYIKAANAQPFDI